MSVSGPSSKSPTKSVSSSAPAAAPSKPKVETKEEKKTETTKKDGYTTTTQSENKSKTTTQSGPGVARPSSTVSSQSNTTTTKSGSSVKGTKADASTSIEKERKSEVSHTSGDGKKAGDIQKQAGGGTTLAEKKGSVSAEKKVGAEWNKTTETKAGTLTQNAQVNAGGSATATGSAALTTNGVTVKGAADVKVGVDGSYTIKFQSKEVEVGGQKIRADFELKLSAEAVAKAGGNIEVAATGNPPQAAVTVGGKAFAGVSAGAELSASVKWVKGGGQEVELAKAVGSAEAHAGAGIEGRLDVGYSGGKLRLDAYAGATLGLGASAGVKAEVNPTAAAEFAVAAGKNLAVEYGGKVLDAAGKVVTQAVETGKQVVTQAVETGKQAVDYGKQKLEETGTAVVNAGKSTVNTVKNSPYAPWNWRL